MSFTADVSRIAKKMETDVETVARNTIIELFGAVITDTPADTGRLKGNWQTTTNAPASGKLDRFGSAQSKADVRNTVGKPDTYYLTNNLPYAHTAEYGGWGTGAGATALTTRDGYSVKAPYGMVRINVKRLKQILRKRSL